MSPGSSIESYPAFAHIGLRENSGKNLNQVTCPDRESNPGHLISRPDALTAVVCLLWSRHVSRMDCSKWTYASTMWDPRIEKRSRRRPRRRLSDAFRERLERSGREQRGKGRHGKDWKKLRTLYDYEPQNAPRDSSSDKSMNKNIEKNKKKRKSNRREELQTEVQASEVQGNIGTDMEENQPEGILEETETKRKRSRKELVKFIKLEKEHGRRGEGGGEEEEEEEEEEEGKDRHKYGRTIRKT
ncbi:hypothetical protein ANN_14353 [Periplaneta americana]|uniref:Uncharacterized protein n=1 Tax=Periplaneta americana TaxID=6978 RepID=A0ABQ8SXB2_PERAM|nr:hypothetical protein ANN_14353 [Periplaneta americana]